MTTVGSLAVIHGYLEKRGKGSTFLFGSTGWRRRYFAVLGGCLLYFKDEHAMEQGAAGALKVPVALQGSVTTATATDAKGACFEVKTTARTLYLRAPDAATRALWLEALHNASSHNVMSRPVSVQYSGLTSPTAAGGAGPVLSPSSASSASTPTAAGSAAVNLANVTARSKRRFTVASVAAQAGWLGHYQCDSDCGAQWCRYWSAIQNNCLVLAAFEGGDPVLSLSLSDVRIYALAAPTDFGVYVANEFYAFRAPTCHDRQRWVTSISARIISPDKTLQSGEILSYVLAQLASQIHSAAKDIWQDPDTHSTPLLGAPQFRLALIRLVQLSSAPFPTIMSMAARALYHVALCPDAAVALGHAGLLDTCARSVVPSLSTDDDLLLSIWLRVLHNITHQPECVQLVLQTELLGRIGVILTERPDQLCAVLHLLCVMTSVSHHLVLLDSLILLTHMTWRSMDWQAVSSWQPIPDKTVNLTVKQVVQLTDRRTRGHGVALLKTLATQVPAPVRTLSSSASSRKLEVPEPSSAAATSTASATSPLPAGFSSNPLHRPSARTSMLAASPRLFELDEPPQADSRSSSLASSFSSASMQSAATGRSSRLTLSSANRDMQLTLKSVARGAGVDLLQQLQLRLGALPTCPTVLTAINDSLRDWYDGSLNLFGDLPVHSHKSRQEAAQAHAFARALVLITQLVEQPAIHAELIHNGLISLFEDVLEPGGVLFETPLLLLQLLRLSRVLLSYFSNPVPAGRSRFLSLVRSLATSTREHCFTLLRPNDTLRFPKPEQRDLFVTALQLEHHLLSLAPATITGRPSAVAPVPRFDTFVANMLSSFRSASEIVVLDPDVWASAGNIGVPQASAMLLVRTAIRWCKWFVVLGTVGLACYSDQHKTFMSQAWSLRRCHCEEDPEVAHGLLVSSIDWLAPVQLCFDDDVTLHRWRDLIASCVD